MAKNDRTVFRRPDGTWANKKDNAARASSTHNTQRAAESDARKMLKNQGGGELKVKGEDGRIRSKDTISPGRDPCPPKDKEHLAYRFEWRSRVLWMRREPVVIVV